MRVQAKSRNLTISAQKLRLCTAGLRGMSVDLAMQQLAVTPKKGSIMVFDALKSASANAVNNNKLNKSELVIEEIKVDQAGKLKRWRPRSRGMASPIEHPKAHLTVVVGNEAINKPAKSDKKPKKEVKK